MTDRTAPGRRRQFYERHLRGETYQQIAASAGVSRECVRYWCRRQRDGGTTQTTYRREPAGLLGHFAPVVRYVILRLRLEHPRWGPNRIRAKLKQRLALTGLRLPSDASIGRYLQLEQDSESGSTQEETTHAKTANSVGRSIVTRSSNEAL